MPNPCQNTSIMNLALHKYERLFLPAALLFLLTILPRLFSFLRPEHKFSRTALGPGHPRPKHRSGKAAMARQPKAGCPVMQPSRGLAYRVVQTMKPEFQVPLGEAGVGLLLAHMSLLARRESSGHHMRNKCKPVKLRSNQDLACHSGSKGDLQRPDPNCALVPWKTEALARLPFAILLT